MQTRRIVVGAVIVAALCVVFYSSANRQVEIAFLIAFALLFGVAANRAFPIKRYSRIALASDNKPALDNKTIFCWIFAITSLQYVLDPRVSMLYTARRHLTLLSVRNFTTVALYVALPLTCGLAWWSIWRKRPTARVWGISASVGYILLFIRPIILFPSSAWWRHWSELLIGTLGLLTFLPSHEKGETEHVPETQEPPDEPETEADGSTWLKLS